MASFGAESCLADRVYASSFVDASTPATNQGYYPEWIITGSGLSDTTAAGRLYDQTQWAPNMQEVIARGAW